ncbi:MAG: DUF4105 domain-containing protein [Methylophagaceae bacterium]
MRDQQVLADISIDGDQITIKNIRNSFYRSAEDFDLAFYDKTFKLNDIKSAWYVVEPFGQIGAAHTFVSFEFEDGSFMAISVEIRREQGEEFSVLKGIFRQYELAYIIASEADLIKLRTNHRSHEVRLFPIKTDKEMVQGVFIDMLNRAKKLTIEPEFYNTVANNCTTNIIKHVRKLSEKEIPWWDIRYLLPEYSDKIVFNAGILNSELSLDEARQYFSITDKAKLCLEEGFSSCIRR